MAVKVHIAHGYIELTDYLKRLPFEFSTRGESLRFIRNELRIDEVNGCRFVMKSYKRIYWPNIIRYSITKSKANKAFHNALYLIQNGIETPEPIAFVELRSFGLIKRSYFLSKYTPLPPIHDFIHSHQPDIEYFTKCLAHFIFRLHEAKVYHIDFSTHNILFFKNGDTYDFSLIDNNRMRFGKISRFSRIRNLERLDLPVDILSILAKEYSRLSGENEVFFAKNLFTYRWNHMMRGRLKAFGKRMLKSIKKLRIQMIEYIRLTCFYGYLLLVI